MRLWLALVSLLVALALCAGQAGAQGNPAPLPDYDACQITWTIKSFNVYQQTTPGGPTVRVGQIPVDLVGSIIKTWWIDCPTAQGTYYYTVSSVNMDGVESQRSVPAVGFTIKGGAPPLVFQIGAQVKVNTPNLNVRPGPGLVCSPPTCPMQKGGAPGQIIGGPVVATFLGSLGTWWQVDFAAGVDGWVLEKNAQGQSLLQLVPTP